MNDDDLTEERRLFLAEAIRRKRALTGLLDHAGWKVIEELVNAQADARMKVITAFAIGENDMVKTVYVQEFTKGESAGLRMAIGLPQATIDSDDATIKASMLDVDNEEEESYG